MNGFDYLSNPSLAAFMRPKQRQTHETESSVSVPPALIITDATNTAWTLGMKFAPKGRTPNGEFAFDVLRNGTWTGDVASRIEYVRGRVRIFTREGWKYWTGTSFV